MRKYIERSARKQRVVVLYTRGDRMESRCAGEESVSGLPELARFSQMCLDVIATFLVSLERKKILITNNNTEKVVQYLETNTAVIVIWAERPESCHPNPALPLNSDPKYSVLVTVNKESPTY
jgi:hypothetical protein